MRGDHDQVGNAKIDAINLRQEDRGEGEQDNLPVLVGQDAEGYDGIGDLAFDTKVFLQGFNGRIERDETDCPWRMPGSKVS